MSQPLVPNAWAAPLAQFAVPAPDEGASDADESTHEDVAPDDVDASAASPAAPPTPMRPPSAPSGRPAILLGLSGRPSSASPHLSRGPRGDTSAAGDIGRDRRALLEHQQRIGTDPKYGAAHFYLRTGVLPETLKRKPMPKGQRLPWQKTPKQLEDARVAAAQKEREARLRESVGPVVNNIKMVASATLHQHEGLANLAAGLSTTTATRYVPPTTRPVVRPVGGAAAGKLAEDLGARPA
jgi:hypothetical protein